MSYFVVESPRRARLAGRIGFGAIALLLLAAVLAGFVASRPIVLEADGVKREVHAGATLEHLLESDAFDSAPGDLLAVDGSIATTGAGEPILVLRNGRPASLRQRLYRRDVLVSRDGADRTEALVTTDVPVPFETRIEGEGPLAVVKVPGAEGRRRVTRGSVSGIEVSSIPLVEPRTRVMVRRPVKPGSKLVALTFDDGPWEDTTEDVLAVLRKYDVRATFFMPGGRVKRNPKIARAVVAQGHLVGSHSYSHRRYSTLSKKKVKKDISRARAAIEKATDVDTRWLRPPYGAMDETAWKGVRSAKAYVVMWDVDSRDWTKPGAKRIAKNVVKRTKPGSVVLLHDGGGDRRQTVAALPTIIKELRKKDYIFVTVEELVLAEDVKKGAAAKRAQKMYEDR